MRLGRAQCGRSAPFRSSRSAHREFQSGRCFRLGGSKPTISHRPGSFRERLSSRRCHVFVNVDIVPGNPPHGRAAVLVVRLRSSSAFRRSANARQGSALRVAVWPGVHQQARPADERRNASFLDSDSLGGSSRRRVVQGGQQLSDAPTPDAAARRNPRHRSTPGSGQHARPGPGDRGCAKLPPPQRR